MYRKRYRIERRDLTAYPTPELKRMANFVHTVGEILDAAYISSDVPVLADLEAAFKDDLAGVSGVLDRIERRIGRELEKRT